MTGVALCGTAISAPEYIRPKNGWRAARLATDPKKCQHCLRKLGQNGGHGEP